MVWISKSFSVQFTEIQVFAYKNAHPSVDFDGRELILIYSLVMWDVASDAH
jgi:hypothetical protein